MSDKNISLTTTVKEIDNEFFIEIPEDILAKCGISIGDSVSIKTENGKLIITKEKDYTLSSLCETLPTDYEFYGGEIVKFKYPSFDYNDCKTCKNFLKLSNNEEFGVCSNKKSARAGKLTYQHQAGFYCHDGQ